MPAADPFRVFKNGQDSDLVVLKTMWPELYDALAGVDKGGGLRCTFTQRHDATDHETYPFAVGRITMNGRLACQECLRAFLPARELAIIPQGYPIDGVAYPDRWRKERGL